VLDAPLAARNDVLTVLPAPVDDDRLAAALETADAAAVIKLGRHFARVRGVLDRLGLAERARYVERATMGERQRILPLDAVDPAAVPYFSMVLVHARGAAWTL
jgi:precorrin-2/cobalt-factor-2 C20-methyltransferase